MTCDSVVEIFESSSVMCGKHDAWIVKICIFDNVGVPNVKVRVFDFMESFCVVLVPVLQYVEQHVTTKLTV